MELCYLFSFFQISIMHKNQVPMLMAPRAAKKTTFFGLFKRWLLDTVSECLMSSSSLHSIPRHDHIHFTSLHFTTHHFSIKSLHIISHSFGRDSFTSSQIISHLCMYSDVTSMFAHGLVHHFLSSQRLHRHIFCDYTGNIADIFAHHATSGHIMSHLRTEFHIFAHQFTSWHFTTHHFTGLWSHHFTSLQWTSHLGWKICTSFDIFAHHFEIFA